LRHFVTNNDPIEDRLREYGLTEYIRQGNRAKRESERKDRFHGVERLANGFGFGEKLRGMLQRADLPMSVGEFTTILLVASGGVLTITALRAGILAGLMATVLPWVFAVFYLKQRQNKRQAWRSPINCPTFSPCSLAPYALGTVCHRRSNWLPARVPEPASKEFQRVTRAMSLGLPHAEGARGHGRAHRERRS
jgi:tight adherence protein B